MNVDSSSETEDCVTDNTDKKPLNAGLLAIQAKRKQKQKAHKNRSNACRTNGKKNAATYQQTVQNSNDPDTEMYDNEFEEIWEGEDIFDDGTNRKYNLRSHKEQHHRLSDLKIVDWGRVSGFMWILVDIINSSNVCFITDSINLSRMIIYK